MCPATKGLRPAQRHLVTPWNSAVARRCLKEHECDAPWSSSGSSSDTDVGGPISAKWINSRKWTSCVVNTLPAPPRGCRCTSIMFMKAIKNAEGSVTRCPSLQGNFLPILTCITSRSCRSRLYTQCPPPVRAKCFILSQQDWCFACWRAPLYSQCYV